MIVSFICQLFKFICKLNLYFSILHLIILFYYQYATAIFILIIMHALYFYNIFIAIDNIHVKIFYKNYIVLYIKLYLIRYNNITILLNYFLLFLSA